ncbi:MAG: hypothetical protein WBQ95_10645 [Terracidiphilus sp.]
MNNPIRLLAVGLLLFAAGALFAGERFDGTWTTKLTCPPKGSTQGYTWEFPATIQSIFEESMEPPANRAT